MREGEPRTTTSTFAQLLSSAENTSSVLLYVHRNYKAYYGRGAENDYLDFHTAPELCYVITMA